MFDRDLSFPSGSVSDVLFSVVRYLVLALEKDGFRNRDKAANLRAE